MRWGSCLCHTAAAWREAQSPKDAASPSVPGLQCPQPWAPAQVRRYPALIGSLAVAAGYFLKIDALGNLHWNTHDALLGLQVCGWYRQVATVALQAAHTLCPWPGCTHARHASWCAHQAALSPPLPGLAHPPAAVRSAYHGAGCRADAARLLAGDHLQGKRAPGQRAGTRCWHG